MKNQRSNYAGYFVAATTLSHRDDQAESDTDGEVAPTECHAKRYIDAEKVPYFVLPGGGVGKVTIGDVVVAHARVGKQHRFVYGLVADAGPPRSFGEGSIALLQALSGKKGPIQNNSELNKLDIDLDKQMTVNILALGGTNNLLGGNYAPKNLESVARQEFTKWNGKGSTERFLSCISQVRRNPP